MAQYPSYGGVPFRVTSETNRYPHWTRTANITRRHIPYSDTDDVQAAGLGHFRITVEILGEVSTDLLTLVSMIGVTGRALDDFGGSNYTNVMLTNLTPITRWSVGDAWRALAEFERA